MVDEEKTEVEVEEEEEEEDDEETARKSALTSSSPNNVVHSSSLDCSSCDGELEANSTKSDGSGEVEGEDEVATARDTPSQNTRASAGSKRTGTHRSVLALAVEEEAPSSSSAAGWSDTLAA
jgi:hypothetical protein